MDQIKKYISLILIFTPFLALAKVDDFYSLIELLQDILQHTIYVLIAIAVVVFLWGLIGYITAAGNEEKRKEAKQYMIWGIVGLFVMVAVWGLVNILYYTFDLDTDHPDYPKL